MPEDDLGLRRATPEDRPAIIALLAASLKRDDDLRFEALYRWKHETNPFGPSFSYVAVDGDRIAGFRALMQWTYREGPRTIRAVRAVDTATHPDYQGRGIFTRLTLHGIAEAEADGVGFVFNTPNDQSRPGYLKMGWQVVGRVPVSIRPRSPAALVRMLRARTPAERWSEPCEAGVPVADVLRDPAAVDALLASQPAATGLRTERSVAYLRWRYEAIDLGYRALVGPAGAADGLVVFRVRRRGDAREIVLNELLAPGGDVRRARALGKVLSSDVPGDYIIRAGAGSVRDGFVPLPRQGPILTWRALGESTHPPIAGWQLSMGDIELF